MNPKGVLSKPPVNYAGAKPVKTVNRPPVRTLKEVPKAKTPTPVKTAKTVPEVKPQNVPVKAKDEPLKVTEVKKQEEKKNEEKKPTSVVCPKGRYELNDLMTDMVETELQDIMIKVWQELPDDPEGQEEQFVVETFRNEAGDHLRNVLGLNITKRLLNVHNPLYVKVQFSGKPEKEGLREFLKKYNFIGFKRIESAVNMFAAQVKTINDFDRICTDKDIRCGTAKVTISPIYNFSKCPDNLITSFNIDNIDKCETDLVTGVDTTSQQDSNPKDNITNVKIATPEIKTVEKPVNIKKAEENKPKTNNVETQPQVEKVETKPVTKVENKPKVENIANKTQAVKVEIKSPVKNTTAPAKTEANENKNVQKQNTVATNKPNITKVTQIVKNVPIKDDKTDKPTVENSNAKKIVNKPMPKTPVKVATKVENKPNFKKIVTPAKKIVTPKKNIVIKPPKVENDFDELDDHDILALISEGIVLDECEGSDQE